MATLTIFQKAPVLDGDGAPLTSTNSTATSSNTSVCGLTHEAGTVYAWGNAPGTATISATRLSDGAAATLDVEVVEEDPSPSGFTIQLGTPEPK